MSVEGHAPKDGMIGCGVAITGLVVVLTVDRIKHPVAIVLDTPVTANRCQQLLSADSLEAAHVVAGLFAGFACSVERVTIDHDDAG